MRELIRCGRWLVVTLSLAACTRPEMTGAALVLDMQPHAPIFTGTYDFDLLDPVRGKACITHPGGYSTPSTIYWLMGSGLEKFSGDALTSQAVAAAMYDAVGNIPGADTIVITRVVAEGHGPEQVCAYVYGRGVRLKKAEPEKTEAKPKDESKPQDESEDDLVKPFR